MLDERVWPPERLARISKFIDLPLLMKFIVIAIVVAYAYPQGSQLLLRTI